ncbi:unnamed protein product [Fusarium graminearum]|uniref:Chromosome 1, complete genome n=1 Tax=Gibberella zeae (strain ATCC MYA-4620 / CBS 123657 / FGSC 9075 / NRRL 31084 / PH-1) TaxID=229533 RepID=A0A098DBT3_GIBZE|nr:unnamed protein product [Fusarium graminearum]CZS78716.1 unnamed protein product [Fusarium graminearum]
MCLSSADLYVCRSGLDRGYIHTVIGQMRSHVISHRVSSWLVGCPLLTPKRTLPRLSAVRETLTSHVTTSNRRSKQYGPGVEFRIDRCLSSQKIALRAASSGSNLSHNDAERIREARSGGSTTLEEPQS